MIIRHLHMGVQRISGNLEKEISLYYYLPKQERKDLSQWIYSTIDHDMGGSLETVINHRSNIINIEVKLYHYNKLYKFYGAPAKQIVTLQKYKSSVYIGRCCKIPFDPSKVKIVMYKAYEVPYVTKQSSVYYWNPVAEKVLTMSIEGQGSKSSIYKLFTLKLYLQKLVEQK